MKRCVFAILIVALTAGVAVAQCGPGGCGPGANGSGWFMQQIMPPFQGPQQQPAQDPPNIVVALQVEGGNEGSGTILVTHPQGAIITAAHLFDANQGLGTSAVATHPRGKPIQCRLVAIDRGADLALLACPPINHTSPPMIYDGAEYSGTATHGGYGPGGRQYLELTGTVKRFTTDANNSIVVSGKSRPGDSGGPIFTTDGELLGVLNSSDFASVTIGTSSKVIGAWIQRCGWTPWQNLQEQNNAMQAENARLREALGIAQQQQQPATPELPLPVPGAGPAIPPVLPRIETLEQKVATLEQHMAVVVGVGDRLAQEIPAVKEAIAAAKADADGKTQAADAKATQAVVGADDAAKKAATAIGVADDAAQAVEAVKATLGDRIKEHLAEKLPALTAWAEQLGLFGSTTGVVACVLAVVAICIAIFSFLRRHPAIMDRVVATTPTTLDDKALAWIREREKDLDKRESALADMAAKARAMLAGVISPSEPKS